MRRKVVRAPSTPSESEQGESHISEEAEAVDEADAEDEADAGAEEGSPGAPDADNERDEVWEAGDQQPVSPSKLLLSACRLSIILCMIP